MKKIQEDAYEWNHEKKNKSEVLKLKEQITYQRGQFVSKTLVQNQTEMLLVVIF